MSIGAGVYVGTGRSPHRDHRGGAATMMCSNRRGVWKESYSVPVNWKARRISSDSALLPLVLKPEKV